MSTSLHDGAYPLWLLLLLGLAAPSQSLTCHTASCLGPAGLHGSWTLGDAFVACPLLPLRNLQCFCCCAPWYSAGLFLPLQSVLQLLGNLKRRFILLLLMCMWGYVLALVLVLTEARRGSEVGSLELELKVIVNCATWKLGSELLILKNSTLLPAVWETFYSG